MNRPDPYRFLAATLVAGAVAVPGAIGVICQGHVAIGVVFLASDMTCIGFMLGCAFMRWTT